VAESFWHLLGRSDSPYTYTYPNHSSDGEILLNIYRWDGYVSGLLCAEGMGGNQHHIIKLLLWQLSTEPAQHGSALDDNVGAARPP